MSWNYRVVRRRNERGGGFTYGIHEVYYNKHGHVSMCSAAPEPVVGSVPTELRTAFNLMRKALDQPFVEYEDVGMSRCSRCVAERKDVARQIDDARRDAHPPVAQG